MTELFVGRNEELSAFDRLLGGEPRLRVLHIWGRGGIGKTKLLEAIWQHYCRVTRQPETPRHLIDLYEVAFHRITSLEETVAGWYPETTFADYHRLARQYAVERASGSSQEQLAHYRPQLTRAFALNLIAASLTQRFPLLLLFDTFEHVQARDVGHWLADELLPALVEANLIVVFAGRPEDGEPEIDLSALGEEAEIESRHLGPFSLDETHQYFDQHDFAGLTDFELQRLHELTEGRPVLVALASDWIREEAIDLTYLDPSVPGAWKQPDFERLLVGQILRLSRPEDRIIPLIGHVHLRFDKKVLAFLQGISSAEAQAIIKRLSRFTFIKYRPLSGSCQLHDEMRVLVEKHVWPAIDATGDFRHELSLKMVDFYEDLLAKTRDPKERHTLQTEQLYYALDADLAAGFDRFVAVFDEALQGYQLGLCELFVGVANRFWNKLSGDQQIELRQREGRLLIRQERKDEAERILQGLLAQPLSDSKRAEVLGDLGANAFYQSDYIRAEEFYRQSLEICQAADWDDRDARIGDIYNQLGLCYRGMGELKRAGEAFEKALPLRQKYRGAGAVAATLTNWAFVYRHLEQLELALGYGKLGLAIRQRLDRAVQRQGRRLRELDYSHHVMGLIYREAGYFKDAIEHFDEALSIASDVEHRFMVGLANADLGYAYYLQEELEEAQRHLKASERIFRAIDHHGGLANILSKLGRLYRKDEAQWEQAAAAFREGLSLAEKVGDAYFAIDNLVNLAKLEGRQGLLDDAKIAGYRQKLDELRQGRYRFPLLLGIFENVLALFETERGNYAAAAQHYAQEQRYMAEFSELHKRIFDSIDRLTDRLLACLPGDMVALSRQLIQQWEQQEMGPEAKVIVQICRMTEQVSEILQG